MRDFIADLATLFGKVVAFMGLATIVGCATITVLWLMARYASWLVS